MNEANWTYSDESHIGRKKHATKRIPCLKQKMCRIYNDLRTLPRMDLVLEICNEIAKGNPTQKNRKSKETARARQIKLVYESIDDLELSTLSTRKKCILTLIVNVEKQPDKYF